MSHCNFSDLTKEQSIHPAIVTAHPLSTSPIVGEESIPVPSLEWGEVGWCG